MLLLTSGLTQHLQSKAHLTNICMNKKKKETQERKYEGQRIKSNHQQIDRRKEKILYTNF